MDVKKINDKLSLKRKNVWEKIDSKEASDYCKSYINYMNNSKTERKALKESIKLLEENGFKELEYFVNKGKIENGDKIYFNNREKSLFAIIIKDSIEEGINIVGSHIDVPRIDFKSEPFYEDSEIAMAKTHYYGGIKKYHWLNIPLEIHGTIIKADGNSIDISIGDKESDPVFVISDLLPHLDNNNKNLKEAFDAEKLNLILGTKAISYNEEDKIKNPVKLNVLNYLYENYDLIEEDFVSAEIEIVPAMNARFVGFDKSLVASYGHDDRICAYTSLTSLIESEPKKRSAAILLTDKEEVGSDGNTGAKNHFWIPVVKTLLELQNNTKYTAIDTTLRNSTLLSSDVSAAYDPNYKDVHDPNNASRINYGIVLTKYTGVRGKAGTNDANAELVGRIRKIWNENNICWQTGELGKTDQGGGGTIAKFFSEINLDVIDAGVPILGMHSPFELASVGDLYETHFAYKAFMENN